MNSFSIYFVTVYKHRYLIAQMIRREISRRYQGSALGLAWSFLYPLLMLVVYTFVFSVVFKARWGGGEVTESRVDFAIILFAGLIVFNLFAEIVNNAPSLILGNVNYVKKVIFPLEILPLVSAGAVFFNSLISLLVLMVAQLLFKGRVPLTALYFPLVVLPLLMLGLGISWFLSALTVYIRDIAQITSIFTSILMFVSAVFFPVTSLPEKYQTIMFFNPVAVVVSESRKVLVFGETPNWAMLGVLLLFGALVASAGYWWFQKTRKGFADVL